MPNPLGSHTGRAIIGSILIGALFVIAWQSGLFGLNRPHKMLSTTSTDQLGAQVSPTTVKSARESLRDRLMQIALATRTPAELEIEANRLEIVTVLPFDSIPAILDPQFVSAEEADGSYQPDEKVLGVSINGDHRAYSVPLLSTHEIVNDTVGGKKIAITW